MYHCQKLNNKLHLRQKGVEGGVEGPETAGESGDRSARPWASVCFPIFLYGCMRVASVGILADEIYQSIVATVRVRVAAR